MRKNRLREVSLDEMRDIQLAILKDVHFFCQSRNINYSLSAGTLIGAVRHKGFIPWDDDIDIMMLRPDYDRFIEEYKAKNPHFVLQTYKNDDSYVFPFAKIYDNRTLLIEPSVINGVYIDIFPIDGIEDKEHFCVVRKEFAQLCRNLSKASRLYKVRGGWKEHFKYYLRKLKYPRRSETVKKMDELCVRCSTATSLNYCCICGGLEEDFYPRQIFDKYISLAFEGNEFDCIEGYDTYLRSLYGDYMKLPPTEKRVSNHVYKVFWK